MTRHLALRYGSRIHPIGFKIADKRSEDGVYIDVKQGGTLIECVDKSLLAAHTVSLFSLSAESIVIAVCNTLLYTTL